MIEIIKLIVLPKPFLESHCSVFIIILLVVRNRLQQLVLTDLIFFVSRLCFAVARCGSGFYATSHQTDQVIEINISGPLCVIELIF